MAMKNTRRARRGSAIQKDSREVTRKTLTMVSTEVQRTLVKSPPELWAELSDVESLSRYLGDLGEIRITRIRPESEVQWEGARTTGTVLINPTGWGTRVKLSVTQSPSPATAAGRALAVTHPPADAPGDEAALAQPQAPERAPHSDSAQSSEAIPGPVSAPEATGETADQTRAAPEPPALPNAPDRQHVPAAPHTPVAADVPASRDEHEIDAQDVSRRGLFARIFGGLRRGRAQRGESEEAPALEPPAARSAVADRSEQLPTATEFSAEAQQPPPEEQREARVAESAIALLQARFDSPREDPREDPPAVAAPAPQDRADAGAAQTPVGAPAQTPVGAAEQAPVSAPAQTPVGAAEQTPVGAAEQREPATAPADETPSPCSLDQEQLTELLTGVLDRLGAAHHRPFSRA